MTAYRFAQSKIAECDERIGQHLAHFEDRAVLDTPPASLKSELHRICGVDLTKIPGIKEQAAQIIISEVGLDMTRWNTEKQFASFLGLCPNNSISGGKVLRRSTRKVYNRAADALRLCSQSLTNSKTALGTKYRRLQRALGRSQGRSRHGPSSRPPRIQNAALRSPLRRKRHGRIRNKVPTSTPLVPEEPVAPLPVRHRYEQRKYAGCTPKKGCRIWVKPKQTRSRNIPYSGMKTNGLG